MTAIARVLVVEDSPTQQLQIQAYLEESGYEVQLAENGRVALDLVRQSKPDMVVTDLEMPQMNGLELVAALQDEFQKLPVVLITARGSELIAAAALKAGAASYVPKQQLEFDLVPTLGRILAVMQASKANERLSQYISCTESEFMLDNDASLVPFLIARLQEDMSQLGLADENELVQVATALDEALVNAIIHGNLEVSSELRAIEDGQQYGVLIEQRKSEPPFNSRRVYVKVLANREKAVFIIRDEGKGFSPSNIPDPTDPSNLEKVSGRGLLLINAFMDEVSHNDHGNEITLVKNKKS
jgi:CheY-like chemotaxis protein